jgi:cobyrinic acid a,c-diamide synthase
VEGKSRIAVAKDDAFCFYYEDNLQILKDMGAELIEFSPLKDHRLPQNIQGMILGGGYPELFAEQLSSNLTMIKSVKDALLQGIPCMAECGGFMYLHRTMENMKGQQYPMVGMIDGEVYKTNRLNRFGYLELSTDYEQMLLKKGETIRGHEYHYFESTSLGDSLKAQKPNRAITWNCIHGNEHMIVGFPHLYYYSNPEVPHRFLLKCMDRIV